jgi:hypothetical protein
LEPAPRSRRGTATRSQKKLANPVADLISVPFQYTGTFNVGPLDKTQHTLNIQPVYPTKLNSDWMLIHRAIVRS